MSVAAGGRLKPWKVMDPRACMHEADKYLFRQGGSYVSYRTITASSASNSSVQWQCNPPSTNQIVSRLVYVTVRFNIEIILRNAADNANQDATGIFCGTPGENYICLRQFPIAAVTDTCKVFINGQNFDTNPKHWIHALSRYNLDQENQNIHMSSSPAQPDLLQAYEDYLISLKSPFSEFAATPGVIPRGAYKFDDFVYTAATGITSCSVTITEPLILSPFTCSSYSEKALGQVAEMNVQINWDSKLQRILSINNVVLRQPGRLNANAPNLDNTGPLLTAERVVVNIADSSNHKITFTYITPQSVRPIPPVCTYDYHDIQHRIKAQQVLAANAQGEFYTDNHTINTIPNKIYLYLRKKESQLTSFSTDSFARIKKISLNFNGQDSLINGGEEWDLWRMSVDNGLKMSFIEWQRYSGSVCCIDFGKNVGLGVNQCVGMLGNYDIQFKVTCQNISSEAVEYDLYTVYDLAGILTISANQAIPQMGIVTPDDVLGAEDYKEMSSDFLEKMYGGSFMSGLRNVYSKALTLKPYAKKAVKFGQMIAPVVGTLAPRVAPIYNKSLDLASDLLGNGYTKKQIADMRANGWTDAHFRKLLKGGNPVGGGMVGGNPVGGMVGGNPVGGKCIPKSKLKQRISNY